MAPAQASEQTIGIVIHGGAGTIDRAHMTPAMEREYRAALSAAMAAGFSTLEHGGSAVDAVVAAIVPMEDSPLFNAGKGAVFTHDGRNELDASIMDGRTVNSGAVAAATRIRNPIRLARLVMEKSEHVMFAGAGVELFAQEQGMALVDPSYFRTERRWRALQRVLKAEKHGTVGAVAVDGQGNLAAGTSTGGMTDKREGRVGDSPIIGAGTYASNASCAVSGTGHGEYFIRLTIARDVCALVEYKGLSVAEAARIVIHQKLAGLGGTGGVIVIDRKANVAMEFNTPGMYRGVHIAGHKPRVAFYGK